MVNWHSRISNAFISVNLNLKNWDEYANYPCRTELSDSPTQEYDLKVKRTRKLWNHHDRENESSSAEENDDSDEIKKPKTRALSHNL